jgi:hypothetical protein
MKPIVKRGNERLTIMEVVSESGHIVGEYKDNGKDNLPKPAFIIERAEI